VTTERSWPHRFRVTVRTHGGTTIPNEAVSWRSVEKAVALAVAAHLRRHPEENPSTRVGDIQVEDLGPVGRDEQGAMVLKGGDLIDRMEF
jgi:hypothetical protein